MTDRCGRRFGLLGTIALVPLDFQLTGQQSPRGIAEGAVACSAGMSLRLKLSGLA